ncbi:MAG TPA: PhzF family phenazine biosynthesis isomerase, partial [bacterium]|nr:PhzF family phenazine biosynthesis isomerase [bacterium]
MAERKILYHVDAFTGVPFAGNAAAVVPDARGLSDSQMQAIAREMNLSETVFAFPAEGPDHDLVARFFSPSVEVPLCGHATVALHHVRAANAGVFSGSCVQKTKAGLISVEISNSGGVAQVSFVMKGIKFGEVMEGKDRDRIIAALGADLNDLDDRCPLQRVYAGLMIGLKSRACLDRLSPNMKELASLSGEMGFDDFVSFALEDAEQGIKTRVRVFAPA